MCERLMWDIELANRLRVKQNKNKSLLVISKAKCTPNNILVIPIARPPKATVKKEAHPRRTWVSVTTLNRKSWLGLIRIYSKR